MTDIWKNAYPTEEDEAETSWTEDSTVPPVPNSEEERWDEAERKFLQEASAQTEANKIGPIRKFGKDLIDGTAALSRSALEGIMAIPEMGFDGVMALADAYSAGSTRPAGAPTNSGSSPRATGATSRLMDAAGVPKATGIPDFIARNMGPVGAAGVAAKTANAAIRPVAAAFSAQPGLQALGTAGAAVGSELAPEGTNAQFLAELAGGTAASILPGMARQTLRMGADVGDMQRIMNEQRSLGATPNLASVQPTDRQPSLLSGFGRGRIESDFDVRGRDAMDKAIRDVDEAFPPPTSNQGVGAELKQKIQENIEKTKTAGGARYEAAKASVPEGFTVRLDNTLETPGIKPKSGAGRNTLKMLTPDTLAKLGVNLRADVKDYLKSAKKPDDAPPELPFDVVREIRTSVGDQIETDFWKQTPDNGALKLIYKQLTKDLDAAIEGLPANSETRKLYDKANKYWKQRDADLEALRKAIGTQSTPEALFNRMMGDSAKGSTNLSAVYKQLNKRQQELFNGMVVRRMMQDGYGNNSFNLTSYANNFDKMTPEVRDVVFKNQPELRASLERLRNFGRSEYEKGWELKTGGQNPIEQRMGGLFNRNPITNTLAQLSGPVGARLMTSPKFLNWVTKQNFDPPPFSREGQLVRLWRDSSDEMREAIVKKNPEIGKMILDLDSKQQAALIGNLQTMVQQAGDSEDQDMMEFGTAMLDVMKAAY